MSSENELEVFKDGSDEEVCKLVAARIKQLRLAGGYTQEALAALANVPLRTYKRFERDGRTSFETFVQILRALNRVQYLYLVVPSAGSHANSAYAEKIANARRRWQRPGSSH